MDTIKTLKLLTADEIVSEAVNYGYYATIQPTYPHPNSRHIIFSNSQKKKSIELYSTLLPYLNHEMFDMLGGELIIRRDIFPPFPYDYYDASTERWSWCCWWFESHGFHKEVEYDFDNLILIIKDN